MRDPWLRYTLCINCYQERQYHCFIWLIGI
jgi:hypothetical protein